MGEKADISYNELMDSESILHEAAKRFKLGEISAIASATEGLGNENYFVSAPRGEYVLRILKTQTIEGLEKEVQIEDQLRRIGVRAPELLVTSEGHHWVEVDGRQVTASLRLVGEHPEQATPEISRAIGVVLAKFHTGVTNLPQGLNSWLQEEEMRTELKSLPADELGQKIRDQLESSVSVLTTGLPEGYVHGDLHFGNLVVDSTGNIAVFDFEEATRAPLILDLAVSAGSIYYNTDSTDSVLLEHLFEGYESVRALNQAEKSTFKDAVKYTSGVNAAWLLNRNHLRYTNKTLEAARKLLTL